MVMMLSDMAQAEAQIVGPRMLAGLQFLNEKGADAASVRKFIVSETAPKVASLVAKELNADKHSRDLVLKTYLTARDPMEEYREVAAYDYITLLGQRYPEQFVWEWEEPVSGGELFGLGKITKKLKKKLKKVGKVVAVGAAIGAAVAATVVTGGAAAPAIAAAVSTGAIIQQQKKAKKEAKKIEKAMEEASAYPPIDQMAPTVQAATQAVAESPQYATTPVQQGGVQAAGQIVGQVVPQAMASYAAGQVAGKTKEQLAIELGIKPEEISDARLTEANAVAAGEEPSKGTHPLVYVGATAAGGLLLALATGLI
jgi:hypothetical protein